MAVRAKKQHQAATDDAGMLLAALEKACVKAGYDASHEAREELVRKLGAALASSLQAVLPEVVELVQRETGADLHRLEDVLRPQVPGVQAAFQAAVDAEVRRREELARLEEEERQRQEEKERKLQARMQTMGMCVAGFAWHREPGGWRCNGGSHTIRGDDPRLGDLEE